VLVSEITLVRKACRTQVTIEWLDRTPKYVSYPVARYLREPPFRIRLVTLHAAQVRFGTLGRRGGGGAPRRNSQSNFGQREGSEVGRVGRRLPITAVDNPDAD
jgi:hypothetical protein